MLSDAARAPDLAVETADAAQLMVEAAGLGFWRWDAMTGAVRVSSRAAQLLGCRPDDVPNYQAFVELIHPDDRAAADAEFRACAAEQSELDFEFTPALADAASRRIKVFGRMRNGADGRFVLIAVGEGGSKGAATRLAATVASSEDAVVSKTLDGIITDWNPAAEAIFGYTAAEMVGRSIATLLPPGQEDETLGILEQVRRGERVESYETRRRHKNGSLIDVSITVSPVRDSSGRLLGASKVARDIGATKRAEAALRDRNAHLQSILDTIPDAMIVIDRLGIIQSISRTAVQMFGHRAEDCLGQNVRMLMPEPDRRQHDGYIQHFVQTGERRIIGRGRIVNGLRKDGSQFHIELAIGEVGSGERQFFTGFVHDLTERERARQQLQDLQAELIHMSRFTAMGEMASALAHELNQPLTAIAGYLKGVRRLLADDVAAEPAVLLDALDRAAEQTLRAGQIIRRLREFVARGETERHVESLRRLIEEASTLALVGAKQAGIGPVLSLGSDDVQVLVDKIQIQQVILNLIRNAIEAMHEAPRREMRITMQRTTGNAVEIAVADSGPGIAPDIAARLFQPFNTSKATGMGVGLSISRTIVEAHGGKLWAEPNPGGGTVFRMTLRIEAPQSSIDGQ